MKQHITYFVLAVLLACSMVTSVIAAPLVSPTEIGFNGQSRSDNYDAMMNAMFTSSNIVSTFNGNLWVPWFKTSSSSQVNDLQLGSNCNSGQTIDLAHNCMVTDELSQVGVLVGMGKDQVRMDAFYNSVLAIKSTNGNLPSWRVYRNGNTIEACRNGINGNCDSASDADARIVTALFTASKNAYFGDQTQKAKYAVLAKNMADDMLNLETEKTCRPTNFGTVCNWLASGADVKKVGITANDFAYTGYYPDAIIAMLTAYSNTNDAKYLTAAKDYTANYLQAAKFNGQSFSAPPGKSFKWVIDANGQPQAQCTNTCNPIMWDGYDAVRALGMCQAQYYASQMNVQLPSLAQYCNALNTKHMSNPASAPLQFQPDGTAGRFESGYFAQGLEALHKAAISASTFKATLDSALSHYSTATNTFDYQPSFGIYTQSFAVRALGMGIGRDAAAFSVQNSPSQGQIVPILPPNPSTPQAAVGIGALSASCTAGTTPCSLKTDTTSGVCRTVIWGTSAGDVKIMGCEKGNNVDELYAQQAPNGLIYKACLSNGCVSNNNGFASFTPTYVTVPLPPPISVPAPYMPPSIPSTPKTMSSVAVSCNVNGVNCTPKSDVTSGACRTVVWRTNAGDIQVMGCDKGNKNAELYRQAAPNGLVFKACMDSACVDVNAGFARFQL